MKKSGNFPVVGIIAEYNPFHNGHAYHIARAKELAGADACVVVMSGDFVQRGAPAVYDKYTRAAMAIKSGADLVLEMPSVFATSSAEDFAACGVALLRRIGIVTHLCFGSECGDIELISRVSDILTREPEVYTNALKEYLRQGMSFPEAREMALVRYLETGHAAPGRYPDSGKSALSQRPDSGESALGRRPDSGKSALGRRPDSGESAPGRRPDSGESALDRRLDSGESALGQRLDSGESAPGQRPDSSESALGRLYDGKQLRQVLGSPNNILGIEYCKAISRQNSSIIPVTITRAGSGYHDVEFTDGFASATGIRQTLQQIHPDDWIMELKHQVPEEVLSMLVDSRPLFCEDFSAILNAALVNLVHHKVPLSCYADVSEELEARLLSMLLEFCSFEERIQRLKTKQYTYTRISRALLHLMLGIRKTDLEAGRKLDYAPYARVLGFRKDSAGLLTQIKNQGNIPLVTKTADAAHRLTPDAYEMLQQDFHCSHIYSSVWNGRYQRPVPNEFSRQIVIL